MYHGEQIATDGENFLYFGAKTRLAFCTRQNMLRVPRLMLKLSSSLGITGYTVYEPGTGAVTGAGYGDVHRH